MKGRTEPDLPQDRAADSLVQAATRLIALDPDLGLALDAQLLLLDDIRELLAPRLQAEVTAKVAAGHEVRKSTDAEGAFPRRRTENRTE